MSLTSAPFDCASLLAHEPRGEFWAWRCGLRARRRAGGRRLGARQPPRHRAGAARAHGRRGRRPRILSARDSPRRASARSAPRPRAAHRRRRVRDARTIGRRAAKVLRLRRGRTVLDVPRTAAARWHRRLAGARRRESAPRGRRPADAAAAALRGAGIESLFGRKDDVGRTVRLTLDGRSAARHWVSSRCEPQQDDSACRLRSRLRRYPAGSRDARGKVNTVLVARREQRRRRAARRLSLDDLGVQASRLADGRGPWRSKHRPASWPSRSRRRPAVAGRKAGLRILPVFTYLANTDPEGRRAHPLLAGHRDRISSSLRSIARASSPGAAVRVGEMRLSSTRGRRVSFRGRRRSGRRRLLPLGLGERLVTRSGSRSRSRAVVPIEGLAADRRLRPIIRASPALEQPRGLGSAVSDRSLSHPPADERYWDDYRDDTEGLHLLRARARPVAVALRRADVDSGAGPRRCRCRRSRRGAAAASCGRSSAMRSGDRPRRCAQQRSRRRAAPPTSASTSRTSASSWWSRRCCWPSLFFKLGVEQRLAQIGCCAPRAIRCRVVRRLLLGEAIILAVVGAVLGVAGAVGMPG